MLTLTHLSTPPQALRLPEDDSDYLRHCSAAHQQQRHENAEALKQHPEWQRLQQWREAYKVGCLQQLCHTQRRVVPQPTTKQSRALRLLPLQSGQADGAAWVGRLPHDLVHHLAASTQHRRHHHHPIDDKQYDQPTHAATSDL